MSETIYSWQNFHLASPVAPAVPKTAHSSRNSARKHNKATKRLRQCASQWKQTRRQCPASKLKSTVLCSALHNVCSGTISSNQRQAYGWDQCYHSTFYRLFHFAIRPVGLGVIRHANVFGSFRRTLGRQVLGENVIE